MRARRSSHFPAFAVTLGLAKRCGQEHSMHLLRGIGFGVNGKSELYHLATCLNPGDYVYAL